MRHFLRCNLRVLLLSLLLATPAQAQSFLNSSAASTSFGDPLIDAADAGNALQVQALLENNASVNARGKFGATPLLRAVSRGNTEVAALLLNHGADVNASDIGGASALHLASRAGDVPMTKLLLTSDAKVNMQDGEGWTPLMRAANAGHSAVAGVLLAAGADKGMTNFAGGTAVSEASKRKHDAIAKQIADFSLQPATGAAPVSVDAIETQLAQQIAHPTVVDPRMAAIAEAQAARRDIAQQKIAEQQPALAGNVSEAERLRAEMLAAGVAALAAAKQPIAKALPQAEAPRIVARIVEVPLPTQSSTVQASTVQAPVVVPTVIPTVRATPIQPNIQEAKEAAEAAKIAEKNAQIAARRIADEAEMQRKAQEEALAQENARKAALENQRREQALLQQRLVQEQQAAAQREAQRNIEAAEASLHAAMAQQDVAQRDAAQAAAELDALRQEHAALQAQISALQAAAAAPKPADAALLLPNGRRVPVGNAAEVLGDTVPGKTWREGELPPQDWWRTADSANKDLASATQKSAALEAKLSAAEEKSMFAQRALQQVQTQVHTAQAKAASVGAQANMPVSLPAEMLPWQQPYAAADNQASALDQEMLSQEAISNDPSMPASMRGKHYPSQPTKAPVVEVASPIHTPAQPRKKPKAVIAAKNETQDEKKARMKDEALRAAEAALRARGYDNAPVLPPMPKERPVEAMEMADTTPPSPPEVLVEIPAETIPADEITQENAVLEALPEIAPPVMPVEEPVTDERVIEEVPLEAIPEATLTPLPPKPGLSDAEIEALTRIEAPAPPALVEPTPVERVAEPKEVVQDTAEMPDAQVQVAEAVSIILNSPNKLGSAGQNHKLGEPEANAPVVQAPMVGNYWLKLGEFSDQGSGLAHFQNIVASQNLQQISYKIIPSDVPGSGKVSLMIGPLKTAEDVSEMCLKFRAEQLGCSTINSAQ